MIWYVSVYLEIMAGLFFVHVNVFLPKIHALWDVLLCHWMRCCGGS